MNYKSQGGIITTVLIILIVLASVVIVWNVVKKTTTEQAENVDVGIISTDLSIKKNSLIFDSAHAKIQVGVSRGSDQANLSAIKFIINGQTSGGEDRSYTYTNYSVPDILEYKVYILNLNDIDSKKIKEILIYPVSTKGKIGPAVENEPSGNEPDSVINGDGQKNDGDENTQNPPISSNLVAYYLFTNGYTDESGNNDGTNHGGVIETINGNELLSLDGNSYVDLPTNNFPYGNSERTICAWANPEIISEGDSYHWIISYGTGNVGQSFFIGRNQASLYGGGYGDDVSSGDYWVEGVWSHVCLVYDGTTASLYSNGDFLTSEDKSWDTIESVAYIGQQTSGAEYWNGKIDNIRIYNEALTTDEITDIYNSELSDFPSCTPTYNDCDAWSSCINPQQIRICRDSSCGQPAITQTQSCTSGLIAYYNFSYVPNYYRDESGNKNDGTIKNGNGANIKDGRLVLDGVDDYVEVPDSSNLHVKEVTISAWINPTSTRISNLQLILAKNAGRLQFRIQPFLVEVIADSTGIKSAASTERISANQWTHVVMTYKSGDKIRGYINNVEATMNAATGGEIVTDTSPVSISISGSWVFSGSMDNIRIYNRALSSDEIDAIYNSECRDVKGSC